MNKVIFLDYDGVLNNPFYLARVQKEINEYKLIYEKSPYLRDFDPIRVSLLGYIARRTGAKIVLTSSWRYDDDAMEYLKRVGLPIVGRTPKLDTRNNEIHQWIKDKQFNGLFVILDDESGYDSELEPHLIYTRETYDSERAVNEDTCLGLQPKHLNWIECMLGRKEKKC